MQTRVKIRTETTLLVANSYLAEFPDKRLNLNFSVVMCVQIFTCWRDVPRKSTTVCRIHPQSGTRDESRDKNCIRSLQQQLDHANISERGFGGLVTMIGQKDITWSIIFMLCLERENLYDRPLIYLPGSFKVFHLPRVHSNFFPLASVLHLYIAQCALCTVSFPRNRTRWDVTSHFTIVISFNIFFSQLVRLRGKHFYERFRELQTLNLRFSFNYTPVTTTGQ